MKHKTKEPEVSDLHFEDDFPMWGTWDNQLAGLEPTEPAKIPWGLGEWSLFGACALFVLEIAYIVISWTIQYKLN